MFEGKPPFAPHGTESHGESLHGDSLHALTWSDLRARLEAARDLRASLAWGEPEDVASFDTSCARRIAAQADGKQAVNLSDLANGKGACGSEGVSLDETPGSAPRN